MRCLSCNVILSDKEATRKYASTGTFIDLCDHCFSDIEEQVPHIEGQGNGTTPSHQTESIEEDEAGYGELGKGLFTRFLDE